MKNEYYEQYNKTLTAMKEATIKKLTGMDDIKGIQEILNLINYYNVNITNDKTLLRALEIITNIFNTNNIDAIVQLNQRLNDENTRDFKQIVKDLKPEAFYKQAHIDSITDFNSMDQNELLEKDGIEISSKNGINLYKLKGIHFNFMVHVGEYNSPKTVRGTDTVHASMISSDRRLDTIGGGQKRRFLVFNNITLENINYMTTRDAWSKSDDNDRIEETKMLPEEFRANCGNSYNDYQLNTQYGKLQPNAICVIGEITDEDIEYAKVEE